MINEVWTIGMEKVRHKSLGLPFLTKRINQSNIPHPKRPGEISIIIKDLKDAMVDITFIFPNSYSEKEMLILEN